MRSHTYIWKELVKNGVLNGGVLFSGTDPYEEELEALEADWGYSLVFPSGITKRGLDVASCGEYHLALLETPEGSIVWGVWGRSSLSSEWVTYVEDQDGDLMKVATSPQMVVDAMREVLDLSPAVESYLGVSDPVQFCARVKFVASPVDLKDRVPVLKSVTEWDQLKAVWESKMPVPSTLDLGEAAQAFIWWKESASIFGEDPISEEEWRGLLWERNELEALAALFEEVGSHQGSFARACLMEGDAYFKSRVPSHVQMSETQEEILLYYGEMDWWWVSAACQQLLEEYASDFPD